ncbi:MAG: metallophosphoesterase [Deltaproteobacteria bacterium]|nr:metallophosphoesterase [Deltaproteobacteria bacterium]
MSIQVFNNNKWEISLKTLLITMVLTLAFSSVSFAAGGGRYGVEPWSFGVMADTQWTNEDDPEGANPEYVSAALAKAIQSKLIDHDVKLVIQLGDLTNWAGDAGLDVRAEAAQPLLDAGIGFFPLRGNHETYGYYLGRDPDYVVNIPGFRSAFPQTQGLANTFGATNFSKPSDLMLGVENLDGLSYSFDYGDEGNNARFVIVDVEATAFTYTAAPGHGTAPPDATYGQGFFYLGWTVFQSDVDLSGNIAFYDETKGSPSDIGAWSAIPGIIPAGSWFRVSGGRPSTNFYGYDDIWPFEDYLVGEKYDIAGSEFWPGQQQEWISSRLDKNIRGTEHAFVLSHRGLMGTNHADGFFGSSPASKVAQQDPFYASLAENDVKYMLSGHDHLHNRAIVKSPDGENEVQQIIHMAASTKFYGPNSLDSFSNSKHRETQIAQDLYNVGYYIYTIDGPKVNVDYYANSRGNFQDNEDYPFGDDSIPARLYLPDLDFEKQESFGYSLNGKQFQIPQGSSYTVVKDSFGKTSAKILAGTNNSKSTDETPYKVDDNGTPDDPSDDVVLSAPRALTKVVNTGWVADPDDQTSAHGKAFWNRYWKKSLLVRLLNKWFISVVKNDLKSDIFSIWGMSEIGEADKTDNYVLSMTFDFNLLTLLANGKIGIATYVDGKWKNAVDENFGGKKKYVLGPYNSKYDLGTYGIDPKTKTAWAVLNYNADFAVAGGLNIAQYK